MSYLDRPQSGTGALILASVFPAIVICIEFLTGLCANTFFDPVPTIGHLLVVSAVPLVNLLLWRAQRRGDAPRWMTAAGAAAAAIATSYAILFLPLLPFAVVAIIFLGVGLLPFAPVAAMIYAWKWTAALGLMQVRGGWVTVGGAAIGIIALMLVDLPATIVHIALDRYRGNAEDRQSAVRLMRMAGDRTLLLRMSYGDTARPSGVASFLTSTWSNGSLWQPQPDSGAARELYYRVTGRAYNAVPRPGQGPGDRMRMFGWDDDLGGNAVGGRVPDVTLVQSRIDGSVAGNDNLGYLEWTIELHNSGTVQREGRFTLALPEGAVASRATLWVNGEPREASIAGRGETRAAYSKVVSASRDPLLVTTDGAQRLLVQAFPILPNSSMRMRIGITAPFEIAPDGQRTLAMPAMVERNFDLPPDLRHTIWVEGDVALTGTTRASLSDAALLTQRPRIALPAITTPVSAVGAIPALGKAPVLAVEQRILRVPARRGPLVLVLDTSADVAAIGKALPTVLDAIPAGQPVGLEIAGEVPQSIAIRPWSPEQAARVRTALASMRFVGGQDDRAALARALHVAPSADATLLWLHGAQPVRFSRAEPALEQALERLPALPRLVRYQGTPGRALTIDGQSWFDTARLPTPSDDVAADLRGILQAASGTGMRWEIVREPIDRSVTGSAHIVRLWGAGELAGAGAREGKSRDAAIKLAHRLNLITPVSGAVVLETDRDYRENDLPVPDPDKVPTVPEPHEWALMALVALAAAWAVRQQRQVVGLAT